MKDELEIRLSTLEQRFDQLTELARAIIHELSDEAQTRLAWKLVNNWIKQGKKPTTRIIEDPTESF